MRGLVLAASVALDVTAIVVAALGLLGALATGLLKLRENRGSDRLTAAQAAALETETEGKKLDLFERVMKYSETLREREATIAALRARLRAAGLPDNGADHA